MICPRCGAINRGGASYCDSCGEALSAEAQARRASDDDGKSSTRLLDSGGLTGWMAFDWLARFATVGFIGFAVGIWTLSIGSYGYSLFFFLLGIVGAVGTWYMHNAE